MDVIKSSVLSVLQRHIGRGNGIAADAIAAALGVPSRQIRRLITELRLEGIAICGRPETGYFIALTDDELDETCEFLYHRAMHSLTIISILRKVPLPELRGQLRLKT